MKIVESAVLKQFRKIDKRADKLGLYIVPQNGNWFDAVPPTIFWLRRMVTFETIMEDTLDQIEERIKRYSKLKAFL